MCTGDAGIIFVFTLARKVDMKGILQYEEVTYVQRLWGVVRAGLTELRTFQKAFL